MVISIYKPTTICPPPTIRSPNPPASASTLLQPACGLMNRVSTPFRFAASVCFFAGLLTTARAELPNPVLNTIYPPGGQAGTAVTVAVAGAALDGLRELRTTIPGATVKKADGNGFLVTIPATAAPGIFDVRAVGAYGISPPRAFLVSHRAEHLEKEPNDQLEVAQQVRLDTVVNGRIEKPGDVDCYRFAAKAGQRVVLDCWAERADSQLRAVLEVYDVGGRRLAVNRGHSGIDPLVDFLVPADGTYIAKVFDLSYLGGATHFYRLDIDTKPRVEAMIPCVVKHGTSTRVKLLGRNLTQPASSVKQRESSTGLDCVEADVTPPRTSQPLPLFLRPRQLGLIAFPYWWSGSDVPVMMSVTEVPVIATAAANRSADHAQEITAPCEVSGALPTGDEKHWFALQARRGEVFWLEAFGERIGAPVDLDVTVLDGAGHRELAKMADHVENLGGHRFPTHHVDPVGRWVAPADGRYLILLRSVTGGLSADPRRVYRLSVRREEPDFHLAVLSRRTDQPAALNVWRGGREMAEVIAFRRRGMAGPIRVTAENLPPGIECADAWIGPGQDRAPLVLTASREAPGYAGAVRIVGRADAGGKELVREAHGGTMIWPGTPMPSARLTQEIALATGPDVPAVLTATPSHATVDQESMLDVAVDVERRVAGTPAATALSVFGLPRSAGAPVATIPAGKSKGWISIGFPAALPPGPYTIAILAETETPLGAGKTSATLVSNPVTVQVRPARMAITLDPRTPRKIARGKTIRLKFTAERKRGFIGKIHTELVAPGGVVGLRARGVTFVGQTEAGDLQVIATEDAPLGRQPFLRLDAIGTVEDQPVYRASCPVDLEIVE